MSRNESECTFCMGFELDQGIQAHKFLLCTVYVCIIFYMIENLVMNYLTSIPISMTSKSCDSFFLGHNFSKKGAISSSNHWFSGNMMLVFGGCASFFPSQKSQNLLQDWIQPYSLMANSHPTELRIDGGGSNLPDGVNPVYWGHSGEIKRSSKCRGNFEKILRDKCMKFGLLSSKDPWF